MSLFKRKSKKEEVPKFDIVQLKVVGVNYKNKDKSDRQAILNELNADAQGILRDKKIIAYLEPFKYNKKNALAVTTYLGQVGNIAETAVSSVERILPLLHHAELSIDEEPGYNDRIRYTADVSLFLPASPDTKYFDGSNLSLFKSYSVESLNIVGYTTANPDGEFVQNILSHLSDSRTICLSFKEHPLGKPGVTYVFANGSAIGYFYKKDMNRLNELLSTCTDVKLKIEVSPSGPGYTDYFKPLLQFYICDNNATR